MFNVFLTAAEAAVPPPAEGLIVASHRPSDPIIGAEPGSDVPPFPQALHLSFPADHDRATAIEFLSDLAGNFAKVHVLHERNIGLQRLAITDDLTGLANGRYFRQFLAKIVEKARMKRFLVTLFLFDIDNFKRYNDQFGHGVGDDILKQTANLMRRCVRDHDLVARISGDEFAVVFWDKEGPRLPRSPSLVQTTAHQRGRRSFSTAFAGSSPRRISPAWVPVEWAASPSAADWPSIRTMPRISINLSKPPISN